MGNCGCKGPCTCGSVKAIKTDCCGSNQQQCCTPVLPCTPTPFFAQSPTCQENNIQNIIYEQFRAELTVSNSWNIPDCGGSAILSVSGLRGVLIGSYLWNGSFGYFQVIGFNAATNQVTIQNNCNDGNAVVGTQIPACSEFVVTDPPSSSGGTTPTLFPFVAIDFTAPAVSTCLDITVTTVNGLAVGKNVQIGSGIYRLNSIPSSTIINICNDGSGITPGTSVIAQNSQGQFQYPVVLIDTNPCTNTGAVTGVLLICDGGVAKPLTGTTLGSIPVLTDADTGAVTFQPLNIPTSTCTILTACLILTPGQFDYTLIVDDSRQFSVGDIIQIGTRTDRFVITGIPAGQQIIYVTIDTDPTEVQTIDPGTSVCIVSCCEIIESITIPCAPRYTVVEIVVHIYIRVPVMDAFNYYEDNVGTLGGIADIILAAPPDSCVDAIYSLKAHVSMATVLSYTSDSDFTSRYQEIQAEWNVNPYNPYSGKMVWYQTDPEDTKDILGFNPTAHEATFNQLTTGDLNMNYQQEDIEALALVTAPVTDSLTFWYKLTMGDNLVTATITSVSFMLSGWVEITIVDV